MKETLEDSTFVYLLVSLWLTPLAPSLLAANALRLRKVKLVLSHIHARPAKGHTLHAQAEFLFSRMFSTQLDGSARADHAVPRQSGNLLQDAHNLTRRSGPARSLGYSSVTRYRSR